MQTGENLLVVQVSRRAYDANFRLQFENGLPGRPAEVHAGRGEPPTVKPWFLDLLPTGERFFRADYLHRLGYHEEAMEALGTEIEQSALLTYLANRFRWLPIEGDVAIPEWENQATEVARFLENGNLHIFDPGFIHRMPGEGGASASTLEAARSQLDQWAVLDSQDPFLMERQLRILTPHTTPFDPDQLAEEDLEEACQLMERLARVHPNGMGWDYQKLGDVYRRRGRLDQAAKNYRLAARYAPTKARPWIGLASCLEDPESAYREALKREPQLIHLRDKVNQHLQALAPERPWKPDWATHKTEVVRRSDVGSYEVCDVRAVSVCLAETRQLVYRDGAAYGYYRDVVQVPETPLFSTTSLEPAEARRRLHRSLLYRLDGRVQDTTDLAHDVWAHFPQCHRGEMAESCWLLETPGPPGFSQKFYVGAQGHYTLVHPVDLPIQSSRPPDETRIEDVWQVDSWSSSGALTVSSFGDWKEVARQYRKYLSLVPGPLVTERAKELGSVESIFRFVEQLERGPDAQRIFFAPPDIVLARGSASRLERCLLVRSMLTVLNIRSNLCFELLDTTVPGPWFTQPSVEIGTQFWPTEPPEPRLKL